MYLGLFLRTIKDVLIIIGEAVDSTRWFNYFVRYTYGQGTSWDIMKTGAEYMDVQIIRF